MKLYSEMNTEERSRYCAFCADTMRRVRGSVESTYTCDNITATATADSTRVWVDGAEVTV
jgi:hypothetical protein